MKNLQKAKQLLKNSEAIRLHSLLETITLKPYSKNQYQYNCELYEIDDIENHLKGFNILEIEVI